MKKIFKVDNVAATSKRKLRVAAYARVSTDSDEQLVSLKAQKEHYESCIKLNPEWDFAGLYYDEGLSGTKKDNRTGLLDMIADAEQGKIDLILTKSISRFARNTTDCLEMVRRLIDVGVFIQFEKENINTGSMESELMLSILSGLAESESVSISQNSKWAIQKRFINGTFIISYPPYGYINADGKMEVVPEEAEIVRTIFKECINGKGAFLISKELNERGIPSKRGTIWHPSTVQGVLKNEKYTGDVIFQKTYTDSKFNRHINYGEESQYLFESHHEAIINHEDFEKAQSIMEQRGKEKGVLKKEGKYQKRYVFSGKITCGECGSRFKRRIHYSGKNEYIAWCCTKHIDHTVKCSMKFIKDEDIKAAFVTMLNKLIFSSDMVLKPFMQGLRNIDEKAYLQKITEIEERIEKNENQRNVLVELMSKGLLNPGLFTKQNTELLSEFARLATEKKHISYAVSGNASKIDETQRLIRFCSRNRMALKFNDNVFEDFVDVIVVNSREEIVFKMKCGLSLKERLVD